LDVADLSEISEEEFDSCFEKLAQFCAFLNDNQSKFPYKHIHTLLGSSIQLEIHTARYPKSSTSLVYDVVQAGMQSIGFKIT
jgi:hypothetical protein